MRISSLLKSAGGALAGYSLAQHAWVLWEVARADVRRTLAAPQNRAEPGRTFHERRETESAAVEHVIEQGIERISYLPRQRRFETPIVFQHGMWQGAWGWGWWQELLAARGWESHAISQPGHGRSPAQRPIQRCTLDYYLSFLRDEVARHERRPVLIGHSMGGALIQWYLKYVGDDLPAAVLVAPMLSHAVLPSALRYILTRDPAMLALMMATWDASPAVRTPERAASALLSPSSPMSPAELHAHLGPESVLVLYQHNPPFWSPPHAVKTPLLWMAGERDAFFAAQAEQRSAQFYGADYIALEQQAHNIMHEPRHAEAAELIHDWLVARGVN